MLTYTFGEKKEKAVHPDHCSSNDAFMVSVHRQVSERSRPSVDAKMITSGKVTFRDC